MTGRSHAMVERDNQMAKLTAEGLTRKQIADRLRVSAATVSQWAAKTENKPVRHRKTDLPKFKERSEGIVNLFLQGLTMAEVGDLFSVTRATVSRTVKEANVCRTEGGQSLVSAKKAEAKQQALESKSLEMFGLPFVVMQQLRKDKVVAAYRQQKNNAFGRGIEWRLRFNQWFSIWQTSGKLHLRGRGKGKYVMSRIGDKGCYEVGNVHIQLAVENSREASNQWIGKEKENRGVFCLYPGRENPWLAKVAKTSLGFFKTEQDAVEARNAHLSTKIGMKSLVLGYTVRKEGKNKKRFQVMVASHYVGSFFTAEEAIAARNDFLISKAERAAA